MQERPFDEISGRLSDDTAPLTVVVSRGDLIESRHLVDAVITDSSGKFLAHWGDVQGLIYPRSTLKPIQALPLVLSGAADNFGLDEKHLSIACGSHNAEPAHIEVVMGWLEKLKLPVSVLECGGHPPIDEASQRRLILEHKKPGPEYNNCSGKHCGFVTLAQHRNVDVGHYIGHDHPVQQEVREMLKALSGVSFEHTPWGIDGCGIPTYAMPLSRLAQLYAKMVCRDGLPEDIVKACSAVLSAVTQQPFMIAGNDRFDTRLVVDRPGAIIAKVGAEGVFAAGLVGQGLGIALKVRDGGRRASDVALAALLRHLDFLSDDDWFDLNPYSWSRVRNVRGKPVGLIYPLFGKTT